VKKNDILKMAQDPQYITGIYNYCDRWCERCPLTSRCLNYAITEKNFGDLSVRDLHNKAFWKRLKEMFQMTTEMLVEWAENQGIDLDDIDVEAVSEEEHRRRLEAENHELSQAAREYSGVVDRWFEQEQSLFDRRQDDLNTIVQLGVGGASPYEEADSINDAVAVIRWYQDQIYIKFMRAITQDDVMTEIEEDDSWQSDADGSVKVALIGMDRSIGAWGALREYFPEKADDILDILVHLDRLRRKAEHLFPNARNFIRPGFDTMEE
jgi:hypothetical protein